MIIVLFIFTCIQDGRFPGLGLWIPVISLVGLTEDIRAAEKERFIFMMGWKRKGIKLQKTRNANSPAICAQC